MTEPHGWPFEQPAEGTLRPWYLTATGYLMVLFSHLDEARRARNGLLEHKVSQEDIRLYESEEILRILARAEKERSILAKVVSALAADPEVKQRFLDNVRADGAALWLVAPTRDCANHLVALLADYSYSSLRYYGEDGVVDVQEDADWHHRFSCGSGTAPGAAAGPRRRSSSRSAVSSAAARGRPAARPARRLRV